MRTINKHGYGDRFQKQHIRGWRGGLFLVDDLEKTQIYRVSNSNQREL